jgi:hypothetical protein
MNRFRTSGAIPSRHKIQTVPLRKPFRRHYSTGRPKSRRRGTSLVKPSIKPVVTKVYPVITYLPSLLGF